MISQHKILGIDIGSVAAGVAVIGSSGEILHTGYRFHKGEVDGTLSELMAGLDLHDIDHVVATVSTPADVVAENRYNNEISSIAAAKAMHPGMRGLLVVGGEKFSLARFDREGHYLGSRSNTSCAAGTGSFLDQQAKRLNLQGIEELSEIATSCDGECPQIASRCAVFAKTDLIHAQQEGYGLAEISDGLCRGLARNIVDTLFTEDIGADTAAGELIFCGGVAKNRAVARHITELTSIPMTIPDLGHLYGAIGAALLYLEDAASLDQVPEKLVIESYQDILRQRGEKRNEHYYPPLTLKLSDYPDFSSAEQYVSAPTGGLEVEVDLYRHLHGNDHLKVYLGVDIGSTSTKAVLMDTDLEVVAGFYTRTAGRPLVAVQAIFRAVDEIQQNKGLKFEVLQSGTTGSGRKFIGRIIGADAIIDEITAHARAACQLNPDVDTIIEIGGQDAKFTTLQNGRVTSSTMNTVCAAGTGSFIEEQAAKLGCSVKEYSARAENCRAPMVSDRCTVFMERDMNHYLSEGATVNEVLASALHAVRENYLLKVATEKNIGSTIFFQGATARNKALVAAFEQRLKRPLLVSKFCHLTGALGTALTLWDEKGESSEFRGFDLYQREVPVSSEVCEICTNHCKISIAEVSGVKVAYGFLCGREYETQSYVNIDTGAFELLKERKRISFFTRHTVDGGPLIGLPAAVHMVEDLAMWQKFFDLLGIRTITSEGCKNGLKNGKNLAQAEFCAPMSAMHGHVAWLLDRTDYVFLPNYLEEKVKDVRRQYCYYTQFLPTLVASLSADAENRVLRPVIKYLYTSFHAKMQLYRMLQDLDSGCWSFLDVSSAYDRAMQFKENCTAGIRTLFHKEEGQGTDIQVVFVGRPYTVLSASMNGSIPGIFQKLGISCYYQDMLSYEQEEVAAIQPLLDELHWEQSVRILEATEVIATRENLYPVFLTSFMCTPDSFTLEYFKSLMGRHNKPYLVLQLDEHDSNVGYETRIEAAIRSFRNHSSQRKSFLPVEYYSVNPRLEKDLSRKHVIFPNWDPITCALLTATLRREGYEVIMMEETEQTIRESLKHNSGQCIPLNAVAEGYMQTIRNYRFNPADCVLWLNNSTLACNIRMYPHHIKQILSEHGFEDAGVYVGQLSFSEISLRAAMNAYFAFMLGGMLRKISCKIRPYELNVGETDRVLKKSIKILVDAFEGRLKKEDALKEIVSRFEWIDTDRQDRPKVALFGDLYVRDNPVMNQDLIRFIEDNGGEVITTPYSEYAKMVAATYFRKWFNEGKYFDVLTNRALLATMSRLEKSYTRIMGRILDEPEHEYCDDSGQILAEYNISIENTGESMDNILKIHYIRKFYPDVSLFVQTSPSLCCPSLITEAMRDRIERKSGVPVVSVTYDGTGGNKNEIILPYLKYPRNTRPGPGVDAVQRVQQESNLA
jgi:predicted CoA-substrate-specific enzyme activase